jgi:hypothetical protein
VSGDRPHTVEGGPLDPASDDGQRRAAAGIAAVVSYRHMHTLALAHGESPWTAALIPLSVDGMVVASSMTLLADSRAGHVGGLLPWTLLATGSTASLAANVAVAEPTAYGRVIAAWPSFALIGAYVIAHAAGPARCHGGRAPPHRPSAAPPAGPRCRPG